jgi:hypothetical protein
MTANQQHWRAVNSPWLDDVAEYRHADYENAINEIHALVDRVERGDLSFVNNSGYAVVGDINLSDLWASSDGYHALFPQRKGGRKVAAE